jgi:hypothetical protein
LKKLMALPALVTTAVLLAAAPAMAESSANTGTYGPAEEPGWIVPAVIAFVVICAVAAVIMARTPKSDR